MTPRGTRPHWFRRSLDLALRRRPRLLRTYRRRGGRFKQLFSVAAGLEFRVAALCSVKAAKPAVPAGAAILAGHPAVWDELPFKLTKDVLPF